MKRLSDPDKLALFRTMLVSRLGDLREQSLIRQGTGWFHVSGMGHEALTVVGHLMQTGDFHAGYYRDRPIALARGVPNYELALSFLAKQAGASGGRQMPAHYSSTELGIFSIPSVVGASLLPACGLAWGLKLDKKPNLVVTTVGDAGTRQGDFFETLAFALEKQLPLIVLVEDNGIGISSSTEATNPIALKVLDPVHWVEVDGCDVDALYNCLQPEMEKMRAGGGPLFVWAKTERISSHSSADDHRKYRAASELDALDAKDPLNRLKADLLSQGILTESSYEELYAQVDTEVRNDFARAVKELDPDPATLLDHIYGPVAKTPPLRIQLEQKTRMVDAINSTFHAALDSSTDYVFFGQDIEDPKGGVFSITKGLSTKAPDQVFNSPLAESTIFGVAAGLAAYGKRPVFEIQFADYIWPGFNQLVTQLSTLHWRSNGEWSCPAVIYAPYGAYLPGGALWHSQTNESVLAHFPGLQIAVPSSPEDAAGLFWTAMHGNSPTIILIPKHLMWHPHELDVEIVPVPFGKARHLRKGESLTLVTWGNCIEVAEDALKRLDLPEDSVDLIDIRSIAPLDMTTIKKSVYRSKRLLVVQEDAESCSIGQKIITGIASDPELFSRLVAAPLLIAKPDVNIGYNPILEYAALPSVDQVAREINQLLSTQLIRNQLTMANPPNNGNYASHATQKLSESLHGASPVNSFEDIRVPILGEGITSARVCTLIAKPGDMISPDDPLCEVETDKAMFPIESPLEGKLIEWLIAEEDEVTVDQAIARIESTVSAVPAPRVMTKVNIPSVKRPSDGGLPSHIIAQMRDVVPAHMTVKAGYDSIRIARAQAKESLGAAAPSPTVMIAWCLVQAMIKHPVFNCTTTKSNTLEQHAHFDFGVAVSLDNDALDTAIIPEANTLDFKAFAQAYASAVTEVRSGKSSSKSGTPLILTSMGGFNVRDALPVVVPPAIGTLFVGEAHYDDTPRQDAREVVSLCLSFDHRWLNGVAGAQFLSDVVREMEYFNLDT